jgi:transcriptional regulator with GAF, ATPase, and Fis domain
VNCTAIPETLLESELFGHRKGAFTGAVADRRGRFALAGTGTVFLDEIGDTSGAFQSKLLRVLQNQEFMPVGAERAERTEARVIAATHRDLESLVREGGFREDLYFRLRVVEIRVPPLRERRADIPVLAEHFLWKGARALSQSARMLSAAARDALAAHDWPGNVRELENTVLRALVLAHGSVIDASDLALDGGRREAPDRTPSVGDSLREVEADHVLRVLAKTKGNKRKAAKLLGVSRARLDRILARHGIGGGDGAASIPTGAQHGPESSPISDDSD